MRLQKIDIYGFGKFIDQPFQLSPGLNIFRGDNGSGKTTIMSFILSVMFGFPNLRKKNAREYDVNENVIYGGRLHLADTRYGNVIIKRIRQANKQQLSMIIEDGEEIQVDSFDELWNGLSEKDYLSFFGFNEEDLMHFVWEDEDQFAKSLVSLGISGRHVLTEINPVLTREADDIYLPNGKKPILNQQLQLLEDNAQQLQKAYQNEQQYFDLKAQYDNNQKQLNERLAVEKQEKNTAIQLELAKQQSGSMAEHRQLAEEIAHYNFYDFEDNLELKWHQSSQQLQQLEAEYEQLSSSQNEVPGTNPGVESEDYAFDDHNKTIGRRFSKGMEWIEIHQGIAAQMLSEARAYRDKVRQYEDLNQQLIEKRYEQTRMLLALGAESIDELPEDLSAEERREWQQRYAAIDNRRVFYENTKQEIAAIADKRAELQNERRELADELAALENSRSDQTNKMPRNFGLGLTLLGAALLAAYFLMNSAFFLGSGIAALLIGIIFLMIGAGRASRNKKGYTEDIEAYNLDIQEIDQELLDLEHQADDHSQQLGILREDTDQLMDELDRLVADHGGSGSIQGLVWIQNDYISAIKVLEAEIIALLDAIGLDNYQRAHEMQWRDYERTISDQPLALDTVFQHFEDDYHEVRQAAADSNYTQHERRENRRKINQLEQKIARLKSERSELLKDYELADESALFAAIHSEEEMRQKRERFNMLSAHLDPDLARYQESPQPIDVQITDNKERLAALNEEIQRLVEENASISSQMANIEGSGLVAQLQQDDANNFETAYDLAVDWAARKLAVAIFEGATVGQEGDVIERVLGQANRYLYDLSNGKLEKLQYKNDTVEILTHTDSTVDNAGRWLPVAQLSRGEKALLFIAMRFAFLNAQLGQMNLPIIIDEGFAHLDADYRENIYRFLRDRAQESQIILFTIDHLATEILPESQIYHM